MYKERSKEEVIASFRHSIGARQAFSDLVHGRITKQEFEARGYKLAKIFNE